MSALQGVVGIAAIVLVAWAMSEDRRRVPWTTVAIGIVLQVVIAAAFLRIPGVRETFVVLNDAVAALQRATAAGTAFVFGHIGGGRPPYAETDAGARFILAFQALPLVLVVSAVSAVLHHWRILPAVVRVFAWALRRTMRIGGAVGFSTAANIFVGMVEAPLLIRPYLATMSRSGLFVVMVGGMASIAGTVMVLYASVLEGVVADPLGHLLVASVMSAPAAVAIALVMVPGDPADDAAPAAANDPLYAGTMDALTRGTLDGLTLLLAIVAMLLVLVACVDLVNAVLAPIPTGGRPITLQGLFGLLLAPFAWAIGIPWSEAATAGSLLGTKVVLNELLAFLDMKALPAEALSERSRLIMTYALCGFANFGSLGIMIGGMGALAPGRRAEIVALGTKSLVAGLFATLMMGAVVGLVGPLT